jgi:CheY-like chemotaxis protein
MTAGARREDRERCMAEGMDGYLAKPINKDSLLALVARSLKRASAPEATIDPAVLNELRVLDAATDENLLDDLVDQFILDTDPLLVELREALERGNALVVGRIAHAIKGSSSQLGGRRCASSCDRLEGRATAGRLSDGQADLHDVEMDYQDLRQALTLLCSTAA